MSAESPRRVPTIRTTLIGAAILAIASVAVVGLALSVRVVPAARELALRGTRTLQDFESRSTLAARLDSVHVRLRARTAGNHTAPIPAAELDAERARLDSILTTSGLLDPLLRRSGVSTDFSEGIERADRATANLASALIGVVSSLEVGDLDAAESLLRVADSLETPLAQRLSAVTAAALSDVANEEALLAREARFASLLVGVWLTLGLIAAPALWLILRRRLFVPLADLDHALDRLERGELDAELPVQLDDEMGRLTQHFNRAARGLREQRSAAELAAGQSALESSEARHRAVFDEAAVGLAEIALDGKCLRINRAMTDVLGRNETEIVGHRIADFTHPDDRGRESAAWADLIEARSAVMRLDQRFTRADGSVATAQVTATLLHHADGRAHHVLTVVQDVTEQHRLQGELLQSQKLDAVGQLAGGVAHDFNNLLTGIIGYAELLEHDASNRSEVREDAEAIRRTAQRGADLSRSLLTLARRNPHRSEPFVLDAMLGETVDLVRRTFDRRIEVHLSSEGSSTVHGDRSLISNALLNLAVNARDAMSDGGTLRIETRIVRLDEDRRLARGLAHDGPYASIAVSDTGTGMSADVLAHLFEPFFTTKGPGKGTGLGLAMVYGTVKDHGGAIDVESELGRGTCFTVLLPCANEAPSVGPLRLAPVEARESARLLVVDDEELVRDIAARMLRRLGYQVETAVDGLDALERLAREDHGFHLVLLDGNMPRLNGLETARRLQARHPGLPLIYASGYFDPDDSKLAGSIGVRELLAKPYSIDALSRAVARCLGPRAADAHEHRT